MASRYQFLVPIACSCVLAACATHKPKVVDAPQTTGDNQPPAPVVPINPVPDDGLRTGNLLVLPNENEYRPTNPSATKANTNSSAVIVTPPKPDGKKDE